jgi:queuine tRNA-ribosyltransferase
VEEILGMMLLTWHNLQFYQDLMAAMRGAIEAGDALAGDPQTVVQRLLPAG